MAAANLKACIASDESSEEEPRDDRLQTGSRPPSQDLHARILRPALLWLRDHHGQLTLERVAARANVDLEMLEKTNNPWISLGQFEKFLEGLYEIAGDEQSFLSACSYRMVEGYGPLRFLIGAMSAKMVYRRGVDTMPLVCRVGKYELVSAEDGRGRFRYFAEREESRLTCLSRQAQCAAQPTLWGMPKARLVENACITWGDDYCEYDIKFFSATRWLPAALGSMAGGLLFAVLGVLGIASVPLGILLAVLGCGFGYAFEFRRAYKANIKTGADIQDAFVALSEDDAEKRGELIALQQRQFEWTNLMEEQVRKRTNALERMVNHVRDLREHREMQVRGYSHDLRNPLTMIFACIEELEIVHELSSQRLLELRTNLWDSAERMEALLEDMMDAASEHTRFVCEMPETVFTASILGKIRRRLKALAHPKGIRTSAFITGEVPDSLEIDPLIFDRTIDNLLINAVKYTYRGSIVVELTASAAFFTVSVSDTGKGIDPRDIRNVFEPKESREEASKGYGVGLSVVVQLMSQIGGKLEVMSRPKLGSTFWAHFPLSREESAGSTKRLGKDSCLDRVLTIRTSE